MIPILVVVALLIPIIQTELAISDQYDYQLANINGSFMCYPEEIPDLNFTWNHSPKRPAGKTIPQNRIQVGTKFNFFSRKDSLRKGALISSDEMSTLMLISPSSSSIKFIIHGFGSGNLNWAMEMMDGLLVLEDCYVFVVDWKSGATGTYIQAVANTRVVGLEISCVINKMIELFKMSPSRFHLLGHSLGAHIAGYAGEHIPNLGRISAFDPAGQGFEHTGIDRSDAQFVDAYHTDRMTKDFWRIVKGIEYGFMRPVGHIDFYINGGVSPQPGCDCTNWMSGQQLLGDCLACSHNLVTRFFIESLRPISQPNQCQLVGFECTAGYDAFNEGLCNSCGANMTKCAILGPSAVLNPTRGNYSLIVYLKTNLKSPFCVYHYHVTLGLVQPKEAWSYVYGKLTIELIGDNGTLSTDWPEPREKWADWFYHEKKEKKFLFLSEKYIGKIREVKLKWKSIRDFWKPSTWRCLWCDYDLYLSSVAVQVMNDPSLFSSNYGNRSSSFIVFLPDKESQYVILKSEGSQFSFREIC